MLDDINLNKLLQIASIVNQDNVGDSMVHSIVLRNTILNSRAINQADKILGKIRDFSRDADIGWVIFEKPILPESNLDEIQIMQFLGIIGTLLELNYCFERVEESVFFTFENSAPVRFYVNGIFHYLTALFLLDTKKNRRKKLPSPGTIVKVLHPIGLSELLDPIYQVFDRPFGEEKTYGETVLSIRNRHFVHGSFSPGNIRSLVKDSNIFNQGQRVEFLQNHWDLSDKLIVLRLQLISILTHLNVNLDDISSSKIYSF